ncbi:MAG: Penicillin-binding protein, 1A family [Candidatus Moranbacteria bacterium GW2011_GWD2_37_9]|nr:MAG: Penicillin-binding protein, 1A family [Candidatus Moranbacteria bacterium GW2011_GWD2_37_9]
MRNIFTSNNFKKDSDARSGKWRDWWKIFWKTGLILSVVGILFVAGVFIYYSKDLPDPGKINKRVVAESTKIYDRTGEHLLYDVHGEEKRTLIPFSEMPDSIKYAAISLEDQDFYTHYGIKLSSIARSALKDFLHRGKAQGGSTITQQFVKNSILTTEKTYTRKIKEVILSLEIEQKFSKDEILGMYLNEIPYGSNAYGVESAAQTFFGKSARELSLDEAAMLAALPNAPTYYSPYGSHVEALKSRQELALDRMTTIGYITAEQAGQAKQTDVFAKLTPNRENISAPHFVMYIKEYLESKYGDQSLEQDGLKVYTTLDWNKQQIAEKVVAEGAQSNQEKYGAANASLVAIDPKTGQILAMVGSKDYFGKSLPEGCITGKTCKFNGNVNVAIRDRQPGSSFKPYVYLTAFSKGYFPETTLFDVETNFDTGTDKEYTPQNYDGNFRGPLQMQDALGMSLNIPAVKTLYLVGVKEATEMAKKLGITGLNYPDRYGLSLVLGGGEVKLLDHTAAFSTLANGGVRKSKNAILRIEDSKGNIVEEYKDTEGEKVVDEKYVAMLDYVISNNKFRAPVFGENNPLRFDNRPVAAKTGTTNEWRDGWTMGYAPSLAVGVWAGNNDNSPMIKGADGSYVAAPIWRSFMDQVLGNYNVEKFPEYKPEEFLKDIKKGILKGDIEVDKNVKVCEIPGKKDEYCLANKYCKDSDIKEKDFVDAHSILWYVKRDDPQGDFPKNPEDDPQFNRWEKGVKNWYENNKETKKYIIGEIPKNECKEDDFEKYLPNISLSISEGDMSKLKISVSANVPYGIKKLKIDIDGSEVKSTSNKSLSFVYNIPTEKNNTTIKIEAKVEDKNGNIDTESKSVSVNF